MYVNCETGISTFNAVRSFMTQTNAPNQFPEVPIPVPVANLMTKVSTCPVQGRSDVDVVEDVKSGAESI